MSEQLKRNAELLKIIFQSKPKQRKAILQSVDKEVINTICEFIENLIKGHIHLSPTQWQRLRRYSSTLHQLGTKKNSLKNRKEILIQKGGFFPALLAPLLGFAGTLLSGLIK
jgi:hypothetical protein